MTPADTNREAGDGPDRWRHYGFGLDLVLSPTVHVVVAAVEPELKSRGHASFVIPPGTPGLKMGQKFEKMGIWRSFARVLAILICLRIGRRPPAAFFADIR